MSGFRSRWGWRLGCGWLLVTLWAACRLPVLASSGTGDSADQATLLVPAEPSATALPPTGVPVTSTAAPTPTPSPSPTPIVAQGPLPAYVWARQEGPPLTFVLYDFQGREVFLWQPETTQREPVTLLHATGPLPETGPDANWALVYWGVTPQEQGLSVVYPVAGLQQSRAALRNDLNVLNVGLAGQPRSDGVACSLLYSPGASYESRLFVLRAQDDNDTFRVVLQHISDDGRVLQPLGVTERGVWYTYAKWGAPVWPVGLGFVAWEGGDFQELLGSQDALLGANLALGWVAYAEGHSPTLTWRPVQDAPPGFAGPGITVADPVFTRDVRPQSVVFGREHLAWQAWFGSPLEGRGYLRVFTLSGTAVAVEDPQQPFPAGANLRGRRPVAWLEGPQGQEVLVLEGRHPVTGERMMALVPPDLASSGVLVPGTFAGVVYAAP